MASFNKVILVGNLTRDPELRFTPKGTAIAKIGLAVNRVWKTDTGETKEEVTFVDIDIFGKTAENVANYLRKGSPALIEGRLKLDTWEDKQTNQKRSRLTVVAETVQFLGSPRSQEGSQGSGEFNRGRVQSSGGNPAPASTEGGEDGPSDDEVPF
ncbi:MAG: single-stranded DNA-binding protein [Verrucomicrobia bacterium]|nr:single-stranded DNA-binding protein [Verrucomicrobiota bacterium]